MFSDINTYRRLITVNVQTVCRNDSFVISQSETTKEVKVQV